MALPNKIRLPNGCLIKIEKDSFTLSSSLYVNSILKSYFRRLEQLSLSRLDAMRPHYVHKNFLIRAAMQRSFVNRFKKLFQSGTLRKHHKLACCALTFLRLRIPFGPKAKPPALNCFCSAVKVKVKVPEIASYQYPAFGMKACMISKDFNMKRYGHWNILPHRSGIFLRIVFLRCQLPGKVLSFPGCR